MLAFFDKINQNKLITIYLTKRERGGIINKSPRERGEVLKDHGKKVLKKVEKGLDKTKKK